MRWNYTLHMAAEAKKIKKRRAGPDAPGVRIVNVVRATHEISKKSRDLYAELGVVWALPETPRSLSFELHGGPKELANGLRRCIGGELEVMAMTFDDETYSTDDPFLVRAHVKKRIQLIAIRQVKSAVFSLDAANASDRERPVYSREITETKSAGRGGGAMFAPGVQIVMLSPGARLRIERIYVRGGVSRIDGPAHSYPMRVGYECLDLRRGAAGASYSPEAFRLTIPRQSLEDPGLIVVRGIDSLAARLARVRDIVAAAAPGQNHYSSGMDIRIIAAGGVGGVGAIYDIHGETETIGNMLFGYCYDSDPSVPRVACQPPRNSSAKITVEVRHDDARGLMLRGIAAALRDLGAIRAAIGAA